MTNSVVKYKDAKCFGVTWHLYHLQSSSSSSYTKTLGIFIFYNINRHHPTLKHLASLFLYKAVRHHPALKHLASLSFTTPFVIILRLNI
jgi:hypothetical protein